MIFLEEFIWKKKYKHRFNLKEVAEGDIIRFVKNTDSILGFCLWNE